MVKQLVKQAGGANPKRRLTASLLFAILFATAIAVPLTFKIIHFDPSQTVINEKRNLTQAPHFKEHTLSELPKLWDQYFKDRIALRQFFMASYIDVWEHYLESYVSEYVTGRGRELFMNHAAPVMDAALDIRPYSYDQKASVRLTAAGKHAYYFSKRIPYYLFLAPDKSTLYPELMPFYADWAPRTGWYADQVETLKKARINFFGMLEYFQAHKAEGRLYDEIYDNCHWNGNALMLAYPFIAEVLAKDNPIFRPVSTPEFYTSEEVDVPFLPYGYDHTQVIKLGHTDDFHCELLAEPYRTSNYNQYCVNRTRDSGSLWVFSDSYFGGTHGSGAVTPLVHNVKTYLHRHYGAWPNGLYREIADRTLAFNRPDAVVEEFVERMSGPADAYADPLLRILGDLWMTTGGHLIDGNAPLAQFTLCNAELKQEGDKLVLTATNGDPIMEWGAMVKADDLGRAVIMADLTVPVDTVAQTFAWVEGNPEPQVISENLTAGHHFIHHTVRVKPFQEVKLRFDPGTVPGTYVFGQIKEVNDLKARMTEDGI